MKRPRRYSLHIRWSDEDCGFVANCEQLPDLVAWGETWTECEKQAETALLCWVESGEAHGVLLPIEEGKQDEG